MSLTLVCCCQRSVMAPRSNAPSLANSTARSKCYKALSVSALHLINFPRDDLHAQTRALQHSRRICAVTDPARQTQKRTQSRPWSTQPVLACRFVNRRVLAESWTNCMLYTGHDADIRGQSTAGELELKWAKQYGLIVRLAGCFGVSTSL